MTAPNDGNAQNVAQPKLRSATLKVEYLLVFFLHGCIIKKLM